MENNQASQNIANFESFFQVMLEWSLQTQIGLFLSAITWIVGGNLLMYFSMKRRGIPYWKALLPTPSGFRVIFGLNKREWFVLFVLLFVSLSFGAWGLAGAKGVM